MSANTPNIHLADVEDIADIAEEATLHITGRDMETQKLKIRFNKKSFQWEYVGTEEEIEGQRLLEEYEQSPIPVTIRKLVKQGGGHWEGSASDIAYRSSFAITHAQSRAPITPTEPDNSLNTS